MTMTMTAPENTPLLNPNDYTVEVFRKMADRAIDQWYADYGVAYTSAKSGISITYLRTRVFRKKAKLSDAGRAYVNRHKQDANIIAARNRSRIPERITRPRLSWVEALALYKPWRKNHPREVHEPCPH